MANPVVTGVERLKGLVSRSNRKQFNKLGVVGGESGKVRKERSQQLTVYDKYMANTQYDGKTDWIQALKNTDHVPVRERKPLVIFNFAKVLTTRVTPRLVGEATFPTFKVPDDPDTEEFFKAVVQASKLKSRIIDPIKKMNISGSVFVRFFISGGTLHIQHFNANHCYPVFLPSGELGSIRIQYVFTDKEDLDENGKEKEKWFRMDLGPAVDILYDNPEFKADVSPQFSEVSRVEHGFGFVQGEWFRTAIEKDSPDGPSLIVDILGFIDEINYSLSQSNSAVAYNQDPQLALKGMDEEEINTLIRSSTKGWNLGRDGDANFLESSMNGVSSASDLRERMKQSVEDVARIVLLDPEKIVGSAQSAKAMEVLHGPLVDLVNELRPFIEERLVTLVQKMGLALLMLNQRGVPIPMSIPPGFRPASLNLQVDWPPIFPLTMEDLLKRVQWVTAATGGNIITRATGTRILAKDFGIEDVELEAQLVDEQKVINPFGAF